MPNFNVLQSFIPIFSTKKRYVDLLGGRGRGGSHAVVQYFIARMVHPTYFRGFFIRRVFGDIRTSLWKGFLDQIEQFDEEGQIKLSDWHIEDNRMKARYLPTGNEISSKGATGEKGRKAKFKSLEGASAVAIEEADELKEEDWRQINESLRTVKSKNIIFRIFNPPPRQHWFWKDDYILKPTEYDGYLYPECNNPNILSIFSTYYDNIIHIDEDAIVNNESYKTKDLDHYLRVIKGLVGDGAKGRIYEGWNSCTTDEFNKIDAPIIYGLDFGYSPDPTALIGVKFVKNRIYVKEYLYETGLTDGQLAVRMHELGITKEDIIIADYGSGGGKSIAYFRIGIEVKGETYRFNMYKAVKKDGIKGGIKVVKEYEVYVCETSKNVWNEYALYRLRTDVDGFITPEPVDADNHTMDDLRYVVTMKRVGLF